jgi:hypothetical protein
LPSDRPTASSEGKNLLTTASLQTCPNGPLVIAAANGESGVDVSLVLPTYNEGKNIAAVIAQLVPVLDSVPNLQYEIIVVDDDSPDRTWKSRSAKPTSFRRCA